MYCYQTSNGREVKIDESQTKKHHTQFNKQEHQLLSHLVSNLRYQRLHITNHARYHVPDLTYADIKEVLSDCTIIEFNHKPNDCRVLVRCNHPTHYYVEDDNEIDYTLCVVISLVSGNVISCYCNRSEDNHNTTDWDRYDSGLDIIKLAIGFEN